MCDIFYSMIFLLFFDVLVFFDNFFGVQPCSEIFFFHLISLLQIFTFSPWLLFLVVLQLWFFFTEIVFFYLNYKNVLLRSGVNDNLLNFERTHYYLLFSQKYQKCLYR